MRNKEDDRLRLRLENRLSNQGLRAPCRVAVEIYQGTATLTGNVQYDYQKRAAIQVARVMDGISGVIDRIKVEAAVKRWDDDPKAPQATEGAIDSPHDSTEAEDSMNNPQ